MLVDAHNRVIDTLRISLTDRCNFRCRYCMPPEGISCLPKTSYLSFDHIVQIATTFVALGGRKLRLTGGEPLLRPDIDVLVSQLAAIPKLETLAMTTNGSLLHAKANELWKAGLRRINISIDTLDPTRSQWITLRDNLPQVLRGLETALELGFVVKLNAVAMKGITQHEVEQLVRFANDRAIEIRFIEFMPLCGTGWRPDLCFPIQQVRDWVTDQWALLPLPRGTDPAEAYQLAGGHGRVGFIESLSHSFCGNCSRIRLTTDGKLRLCLFAKDEYDLVPYLNDPIRLSDQIRNAVWKKPEGHGAQPLNSWHASEMPTIMSIGG